MQSTEKDDLDNIRQFIIVETPQIIQYCDDNDLDYADFRILISYDC